jgi:peptide-methionine (R)-S-oxide reductase
MTEKIELSDKEWRQRLSSEQYRVLRKGGTERAFTGKYADCHDPGVYRCAGCGSALFASDHKFESGTGWPSFDQAVEPRAVSLHDDRKLLMRRIEVRCRTCDGHLGHVFQDGPRATTGERYCINSAALILDPTTED